jgi:hypothetical protein
MYVAVTNGGDKFVPRVTATAPLMHMEYNYKSHVPTLFKRLFLNAAFGPLRYYCGGAGMWAKVMARTSFCPPRSRRGRRTPRNYELPVTKKKVSVFVFSFRSRKRPLDFFYDSVLPEFLSVVGHS